MILFAWLTGRRPAPAVLPAARHEQAHPVALQREGILDYQRPRPRAPGDAAGAGNAAALFFAGFFGGPIMVVVLANATRSGWPLFGVPGAAVVMACFPRVRALGAGILAGIGTCFLILLSICGGLWR
jgi:hypothetical protein